jgi:hypothetical protein
MSDMEVEPKAGGAKKWLAHVKSTYAALKKKNPKASLGDAMKAAKKTYKKSKKGGAALSPLPVGGRRRRKTARGGRK